MTTAVAPTTEHASQLLDLHKADLQKIERIKKEIGEPNDDNLDNPVPLFNQITRAA